jgi:ABC-type dipeptide/oligopeptide/nickel transport system ATPase component
MLFITHDLGLIGYLADTAAVMNRGKIVELAPAADLLNHPKDAYTQALLKAY